MGCPVTHWQILSRNPDQSAAFYAELFGWRVDANNALSYRMVSTESGSRGIPGGIWPSPPEGHDLVQLFVEVPDVLAALGRITDLGGRVIIGRQVLPDGDELAIATDPGGIPFGVWRPKNPGGNKSAPT